MRNKKKLLLVFFTSIILSLQIFYVTAFAAAPSFYPDYFEAVFKVSGGYYPSWTPSALPSSSVRQVDYDSYFDESVGSFMYTGPITEDTVAFANLPTCAFDGEAAGIRTATYSYATNMVLFQVPLNISSTGYELNLSLTWYGSNIDALKIDDSLGNRNFIGCVNFGYPDRARQYSKNAVLRIYAFDSLGSYTLIPTENITFTDLYLYEDAPLNPVNYNNGAYFTVGSRNDTEMYARDIIISDFSQNDISYLQIYILSTTVQSNIPLFDGAMVNGESVSSFTFGVSNVPYFQRLGIKASNWLPYPPEPPTDNEIIIDGIENIGQQLKENFDYLTIPDEIQKGIVNEQKDRFDNVSSDLDDIGASISGDGFFVEKGEVVHNNRFMNLFNVDHFNNSLGRVFNASVVIRLFFLMITFGLMSYVLFGKAA